MLVERERERERFSCKLLHVTGILAKERGAKARREKKALVWTVAEMDIKAESCIFPF